MPAYDEFNSLVPAANNSPTDYQNNDVKNIRALRDMVITGRVPGFVQSRTQGTGPDVARPQYLTWLNATLSVGFRATMTWGGTGNWQLLSIAWHWTSSTDYPTVWTAMGSAQANTYDGSNNITATTFSGGMFTVLFEVWTKCLKAVSDLATHIAGTGTGVHGLGTMSTQNSNNVTVSGGTGIDNVPVGQSTPREVNTYRIRERSGDYGAIGAGGNFQPDAAAYGYFYVTPHSTQSSVLNILAPANPPVGALTQTIVIEIRNGKRDIDGRIVWNAAYRWSGGSGQRPADTTLELSGSNIFVATWNGTNWDISHMGKRG